MNHAQKLQVGSLPIRRGAEYVWNNFTGRSEVPVRPYYVALDVTYRCNLSVSIVVCGIAPTRRRGRGSAWPARAGLTPLTPSARAIWATRGPACGP